MAAAAAAAAAGAVGCARTVQALGGGRGAPFERSEPGAEHPLAAR